MNKLRGMFSKKKTQSDSVVPTMADDALPSVIPTPRADRSGSQQFEDRRMSSQSQEGQGGMLIRRGSLGGGSNQGGPGMGGPGPNQGQGQGGLGMGAPGPGQGGSNPNMRPGGQPNQGGPGMGGPNQGQGQGGPGMGGPGPNQGQGQGGPGPGQGGSNPNMRPGGQPNQGGPGPNQGQGQGGPGMGGPGPGQGGSNPNMRAGGQPNQGGPGPNQGQGQGGLGMGGPGPNNGVGGFVPNSQASPPRIGGPGPPGQNQGGPNLNRGPNQGPMGQGGPQGQFNPQGQGGPQGQFNPQGQFGPIQGNQGRPSGPNQGQGQGGPGMGAPGPGQGGSNPNMRPGAQPNPQQQHHMQHMGMPQQRPPGQQFPPGHQHHHQHHPQFPPGNNNFSKQPPIGPGPNNTFSFAPAPTQPSVPPQNGVAPPATGTPSKIPQSPSTTVQQQPQVSPASMPLPPAAVPLPPSLAADDDAADAAAKIKEDAAAAAKKADEARSAEAAKKLQEAKAAEDARKADEARKAEEVRKADEARKSADEAKKAEEAKTKAATAAAEETRKAEELKKADAARKAEDLKKAEVARAQEQRAEEAALARKAEQDAARQKNEAKKSAATRTSTTSKTVAARAHSTPSHPPPARTETPMPQQQVSNTPKSTTPKTTRKQTVPSTPSRVGYADPVIPPPRAEEQRRLQAKEIRQGSLDWAFVEKWSGALLGVSRSAHLASLSVVQRYSSDDNEEKLDACRKNLHDNKAASSTLAMFVRNSAEASRVIEEGCVADNTVYYLTLCESSRLRLLHASTCVILCEGFLGTMGQCDTMAESAAVLRHNDSCYVRELAGLVLRLPHQAIVRFSVTMAVDVTQKNSVLSDGMKCPDHPGEALQVFCTHDDKLICGLCASVGRHRTHHCVSLADLVSEDSLRNQLDQVMRVISVCSTSANYLHDRELSFVELCDGKRRMINTQFEALTRALMQRRSILLNQVDGVSERARSELDSARLNSALSHAQALAAQTRLKEISKKKSTVSAIDLASLSVVLETLESSLTSLNSPRVSRAHRETESRLDDLQLHSEGCMLQIQKLQFGEVSDTTPVKLQMATPSKHTPSKTRSAAAPMVLHPNGAPAANVISVNTSMGRMGTCIFNTPIQAMLSAGKAVTWTLQFRTSMADVSVGVAIGAHISHWVGSMTHDVSHLWPVPPGVSTTLIIVVEIVRTRAQLRILDTRGKVLDESWVAPWNVTRAAYPQVTFGANNVGDVTMIAEPHPR